MSQQSAKATLLLQTIKSRTDRTFSRERKRRVAEVKAIGRRLSAPNPPDDYHGPRKLRDLANSYRVSELLTVNNEVPLIWYPEAPNYGDLLSPWLVGKMTGKSVTFAEKNQPGYVVIGSVIATANKNSIVWGSGSFGAERRAAFEHKAEYRAVRGPLTRSRLLNVGIDCPRVYGDPALLSPLYFYPKVEKEFDVGIVVRHSEYRWRNLQTGSRVKLIDFGSADVETRTLDVLRCRTIISSSLHGLIIADAYGIPNVWLGSDDAQGGSRPWGGEFKFYDYFASVNKLRHAQYFPEGNHDLSPESLRKMFSFDGSEIDFDYEALLDSSPFLEKTTSAR